MKKHMIKVISIILACVLVLGGIGGAVYALNQDKPAEPAEAAAPAALSEEEPSLAEAAPEGTPEKDESVYVLAGADGSVQKIIISDWMKDALGENVSDAYAMDDKAMQVWDAQGDQIYYNGDMEKELPVSLSMSYELDGKPIAAEALAGKSGKVTIRFDYKNNQKKTVQLDGKATELNVPFAMLTGLLLDSDKFTNVQVSNGKLLSDGNRIAVLGFAFPGLQEDLALDKEKLELPDYVEITADVKDFSMGMTVSIATNELFSEVDSEKLDSYDDLTDSLGKLTDAMGQLMDGSSKLYDGLCTLLDKSEELVGGLDRLAIGASVLKDGAMDLDAGAGKLSTGAVQLNLGHIQLTANNDALNGGAKEIFESLLSKAETQLTAAGIAVPHLTMDNYQTVLDGVVASLDEKAVRAQALQAVTEAVEANRPQVTEAVTAAVRAQVVPQVTQVVRAQVTEGVSAAVRAEVAAAAQEQVAAEVTAQIRAEVMAQVLPTVLSGMTLEDYEKALADGQLDAATQAAIDAAVNGAMAAPETSAKIKKTTAELMNAPDMQKQITALTAAKIADPEAAAKLTAAVDAKMATDEIVQTIAANVDKKMAEQEICDTIAKNTDAQIEKLISEQMESDTVKAKLDAAAQGVKTIVSLKASLASFDKFYDGLGSYTAGVSDAEAGSKALSVGLSSLKKGASKLSDGAVSLYEGILQMRNGVPALVDGVTELRDGALQLSDGLKQFNENGVQKLIDAAEGDLGDLIARFRASIDLAKQYRCFSDATEQTDDAAKFIYRTDEISQ